VLPWFAVSCPSLAFLAHRVELLSTARAMATLLHPTSTLSYRERASLPTTNPLASYLLRLISIKKTNLCLSADVETSKELLELAKEVGDSICILKTHCDIVTDWSDRTARALREIARSKSFLVFEDRKFADIGGKTSASCPSRPLAPAGCLYTATFPLWATCP
jgi:hypothetical protein